MATKKKPAKAVKAPKAAPKAAPKPKAIKEPLNKSDRKSVV